MDILFGSAGVAAADQDRMRAINREIGLDELIHGRNESDSGVDEKGMQEKTLEHDGSSE